MITNLNVLHRQVIFLFGDQSVIATFHHEPGESDYFAGHFVAKLDGQYRKVTLRCISGIGASAIEERIVPDDAVNSVNGQTGAVVLGASDVGALPNDTPIPSAVTEQTVSGWGFTKNTGTYSKPSSGIPKADLASAVQTSLGKADTALQSVPTTYRTAAAQDAIDATLVPKPENPATGAFLVYNGSTWVAQTLSTWQGGSY